MTQPRSLASFARLNPLTEDIVLRDYMIGDTAFRQIKLLADQPNSSLIKGLSISLDGLTSETATILLERFSQLERLEINVGPLNALTPLAELPKFRELSLRSVLVWNDTNNFRIG